ncbi:MAG: hypothetical protein HN411_00140 [Waddliaceae bacterium]|nr:hypothetical protein [Waddliaceae bacterium]MBT3578811.1 hypothetical protein [Waddliaceae bacterium]MBT4444346.1 hypothetical protein [Waddliaceae bacterium]MBT6928203.1 hypothetical protein [Waddliaceae bacterium]MBT7264548.1 hypothetical protein [Waddliaceae bacterium]
MVRVSDIKGLVKHRDEGIIVIVGKDAYERGEAIKGVIGGNDTGVLYGEGLTVASLLQELDTVPLFGDGHRVVVYNIDKASKCVIEALKGYISKPMESLSLVLTASSLPSNTVISKGAEKNGVLLRIADLKDWERERNIQPWIVQRFTDAGKKVSGAACVAIIKGVGTDKQLLVNEIEKLVIFVGDRGTIEVGDVAAITTMATTETIWQWRDALLDGDGSGALRIGKALLYDGAPIQMLLANLRTQYQTGYKVCDVIEGGGAAHDVTALFPYMRGNILERNMSQCRKYGSERFRKGLIEINASDLLSRNSMLADDFIVETLMVKLTDGEVI